MNKISIFIIFIFIFACSNEEKIYQGYVIDKYMAGTHMDDNILVINIGGTWKRIKSTDIYYSCEIGDEIIFVESRKGNSIGQIQAGNGYYTTFINRWEKINN